MHPRPRRARLWPRRPRAQRRQRRRPRRAQWCLRLLAISSTTRGESMSAGMLRFGTTVVVGLSIMGTPTRSAFAGDASAKEAPAKEPPAKEAPAKDAQAKDAPAKTATQPGTPAPEAASDAE